MFGVGSATAAVLLAGIVSGVVMGSITAVAACYAVAVAIIAIPAMVIPARLLDATLRDVVAAVGGSFAAAAVMAAVVGTTDLLVHDMLSAGMRLLLGVSVGVATYLTAVKLLRLSAVRDLHGLLRPYISEVRRARRAEPATSR
jgi:hypothetical protein